MTRWTTSVVVAGCVLALGGVATAQQPASGAQPPEFGVRAPAPSPVPELGLEPTRPPEETGAREQEFYPGVPIRSRHDPAFVRPFVTDIAVSRTSAARLGLSGWTAPALPYDFRDATGGVAFGLTVVWGVPVAEPSAPRPEETNER